MSANVLDRILIGLSAVVLTAGAVTAPRAVAAQATSASFTVSVDALAKEADAGLCRTSNGSGIFGATVTVVCATGTFVSLDAVAKGMPFLPMHGGAYRYLTRVSSDDNLGTIDTYGGSGTSTAFRVIPVAGGRDYVEMTVGW